MAHSSEAFHQFQDQVFSSQQHYNQYAEPQYYQSPVPVQQGYYSPSPQFVNYDNQSTMYVNQGTTFFTDTSQWQQESPHPQPHMNNQFKGQGQPQQRSFTGPSQRQHHGNFGQRGGRSRSRGQQSRGQNRQKLQEYHQRLPHDQFNPDVPVESLKPRQEDHRVEQDFTYQDVLTSEENGAEEPRPGGGGRGGRARQKHGGRGTPQRNYQGRQYESRQYPNSRPEHHMRDNRDGPPRAGGRGGRGGRGGGYRGDFHRNHQPYANYNDGFDRQNQASPYNKKSQPKQELNEHEGSPNLENGAGPQDNKKGGKQIKFREFHSGNKPGNMSNKSQPRGKPRNFKRVNLQEGDLETQRGALIEQLTSAEYECMVCCDSIRQDSAVWNCANCHHVFHLHCVKRWARSPAASVDGDKSGGWRCPACQNLSQQFPHHYNCFCGKVRDPEWNRFDTPHSCGEVCKKQRNEDCLHACSILCHPGPCPPCHASVTKGCNCGKTKQTVKCGQPAPKCVQVCQKQLNCGKHECSAVCHLGACLPCDINVAQVCYCGKEKREVVCGTAESFSHLFSCQSVCGRDLDCGNHACDRTCHPGACQPCQLGPEALTHCACGKHLISEMGESGQRTSCLDPVPTCDDICDKILKCGRKDQPHRCSRPCHQGDCEPCEDGLTPVVCRCAILQKDFPCQEAVSFTPDQPFLCDKRCNRKRQCGRHRCPIVCCVEEEHPCSLQCGGKLSCGLHRCEEPCHRGNCPTCWQVSFDEMHCHCGAEVMYPPIPCGTKPPPCNRTCRRQHECDHPVRHPCHSDPACPPCTELTERWCMGRHELRRNIACHLVDITCGLPCGQPLRCGQHTCQLICHKGECEPEESVCQQPCAKLRGECSHPCGAPCHAGPECPRGPCQAQITIKCKCGNRSERALCQLGGGTDTSEYQKMATMMMAMKMAAVQSGQSIDITSLTSTESGKKKVRQLDCTKECAILERNKRLALALEIKNPDLQGKLGNPTYSLFLRDFTKQNMNFVVGVEKQLADLVLSAQKSKQMKRSHAFPPMNSAQRRVIHELAEQYGCQTQSYDVEPKKNVVVTAYKDKCWQPNVTLVTAAQREIYPKGPIPIPHGSAELDPPSAWGGSEIKSKSTKVKMAPWGKSSTAAVRPGRDSPEPAPTSTVTSWAAQVKRSTSPTVETEKHKEPEIDYFDMTS